VPGKWLSGKRLSSPSVWAAALGEEGLFLECLSYGSRGRGCLPLGEEFFKTSKRRRLPTTASTLPLVLGRLSGKPFPSARYLALGEDVFPVKRYFGHSSPSVALGEGFPECNWAFPESS